MSKKRKIIKALKQQIIDAFDRYDRLFDQRDAEHQNAVKLAETRERLEKQQEPYVDIIFRDPAKGRTRFYGPHRRERALEYKNDNAFHYTDVKEEPDEPKRDEQPPGN